MSSMVASSMAKAFDDVGDPAAEADDRTAPSFPHPRLTAMAAVAISPPRKIRPFRAFKAVTS
jgi:hypothetical protein